MERYWLEVSEREDDLGVDLNAPAANEVGGRFWSYDLVNEVGDGDIVLHYDRAQHALVAWSYAVGSAWEDDVVWAARGTFARGQNIQPHERPGLRLALRGPFMLSTPLTLERIRAEQTRVAEVRANHPYFPFEFGSRPTRPLQGYLFKLPFAFLELFRELNDVPRFASNGAGTKPPAARRRRATSGAKAARPEFQAKNEQVRSRRAEPWSRDPSEVDRGLAAHARIERLVAEAAADEGWQAKGYGEDDPEFDVLLEPPTPGAPAVVVEVKSTTARNEEKQLRLALGQVLRYQQLLHATGDRVVAFVAIEQPPRDPSWVDLCRENGVTLVWPEIIRQQLSPFTSSAPPTSR